MTKIEILTQLEKLIDITGDPMCLSQTYSTELAITSGSKLYNGIEIIIAGLKQDDEVQQAQKQNGLK